MNSKILRTINAALAMTCFSSALTASVVAHFPMDVVSGQITESISGAKCYVRGNFAPENVPGAVGQALRFDGYTSYVEGELNEIIPDGTASMTVSAWVALPCYPTIEIDKETSVQTPIVSTYDEKSKTGFGFFLGYNGAWSFKAYIGGWEVTTVAMSKLPVYQWNCLTAVIETGSRKVTLYNNGIEVGSSRCAGSLHFPATTIRMGRGTNDIYSGPFLLTSYNGLVDDITIWNEALPQSTIAGWTAENAPDLDIPASRFADDILRPRFHGMPAAGWTNECHGMYHSDGRYHLFFQKNANGPYMARLHWGHISSENLYDWREEKIALAPGEWYDIKGCWSGCVFADDVITGGDPNILYTAVDYGKATIAQASPESPSLENWIKSPVNPIINGRPTGLSDDFRDPYFFRSGDNAYIIVGSSKNGIGTTTLHKYDQTTKRWSNNGDLFFSGTSASRDGSFWEMPNITQMPDGRWLFTATPLGTSSGVRTLYWTGDISSDGKFIPDRNSSLPKLLEMNSREGFGMLSPTIYRHGDKTIALGIVPDKLPSATNWKQGWAHCYSLPRELSLADDGMLVQKPFEGLTGLRTEVSFSRSDHKLIGTMELGDVKGRELELQGTFEVGTDPFGFRIFSDGSKSATISYNPASGEIIADFSQLPRLLNDIGVYDGIYRCPLVQRPSKGGELKLHVFVDHSILDIFVNDRWATSIRVFPTDKDAVGAEVFSTSSTKVKNLNAWILSPESSGSGIDYTIAGKADANAPVTVYNPQGIAVKSNVPASSALTDLPAGLYIVNGRKYMVR